MQINGRTFLKLSVLSLLILLALSTFFAQQQVELTPTPSPEASPTASPTPTPSPTPLPGAQNFHQWGSITVFNGLPSDSVRAIAQTPDGVMWFGTDNGLARFDGRRIQNFSLGDPEANRILALETVANGDLWIGTRNGAFIYSNLGLTTIENTPGTVITAIVGRGNDIFRAGTESEVVLGTETGFVLVVRKQDSGTRVGTPLFPEPIKSPDGTPAAITGLITTDHGGILAATAGRGVFFVDDGVAESEATLRAPSPFVNAIVRDSDFKVWLGIDATRGGNGVAVAYPDGQPIRITAPTSKVLTLVANEQGSWAGTERYGLFNFVDSKLKKSYTFANTSGGLRSDTIYTLFTDREGVLWIGTNRGVSRFDRLGASQETLSDSANANFIRTLFRAADGTIYAGSNRGLFRKVNDKWEADASQGNRAIFALSEERSGKLLVGSVERSSLDQKASTEAATWAFADFKGEKYAAVNGVGLVQLCPGGNIVRAQERSISSLSAVGEKLYFGTIDKGLFSFDGQALKNEVGPDRLQSGTIWKINSEVDGALLIAGQHGVFRICDQHVEKIIAAEEVRDVFIDGTHIWAATTTRGLLQARHDERFGLLVSEVGFEQGLPSEKAFSILATEDGILVATNRGVVTYRRGSVPPKIIATRIASQRSHDLREAASTIALEYPQNSLLVEVAGQSSRTFPEEFQYAFVLANAKGEEIDRRLSNDFQYSPSGLAAGEYTIEAIAFNRDLLASEALAIRFSVAKAPFPWTATALGVLLVIALLGLVWAFVANRRVLVRNRQLAAAKLDLANEAERERRRIARDLHDQTLADLRSLMLLSDAAKPEIAGFRDEIEAISGEVRRICEDLSPSVLENVGLVAALEFLLKGAIANHSFSAKEHLEENLGFSMNVQLQIYRIAQEVLTNIKSHSSVDSVEMAVDESDGEFVMKIRDDGGAFDPESVTTRGRGIANIRARASMIGADIDWEPNTGSGNRFRLKVSKESRLGLS